VEKSSWGEEWRRYPQKNYGGQGGEEWGAGLSREAAGVWFFWPAVGERIYSRRRSVLAGRMRGLLFAEILAVARGILGKESLSEVGGETAGKGLTGRSAVRGGGKWPRRSMVEGNTGLFTP